MYLIFALTNLIKLRYFTIFDASALFLFICIFLKEMSPSNGEGGHAEMFMALLNRV